MFFCNNQLLNEVEAIISPNQRGLMLGDGVFETCKISCGVVDDFESHLTRLEAALRAFKISADLSQVKNNSEILIKKNQIENGLLRISISRGTGSLGYLPTYESAPLIIIQTLPERKISADKITLGISPYTTIPSSCYPSGFKTMSAMPNILTKIFAAENNFFDAVMMNCDGFISSAAAANIFWIKDKKIYTPATDCDIIRGTIRQKLLQQKDFPIIEVQENVEALKQAQELFLTNSSFLLLPVDDLIIGDEKISFEKKITLDLLSVVRFLVTSS